jgi:phosphoribosylamine--glycine ligase
VKADGLAAGKGAVVCRDAEETQKALAEFMLEGKIGAAGETVVVEEFLEGSEISILAIVSGSDILVLPTAQDHKQALDGDDGPNTGGMGAYSPCLHVTEAELVSIERDIIIQTIHAMAIEGSPYTGVLYAGLMLTPKGPHVLEFNCRLGDPETQAIFPRFKGDLGLLLKGAVEGKLAESYDEDCWDPRHAVSVVMASEGYPGQYRKGLPITGLTGNYPPDVHVFHCGTRKTKSGEYLTTGGRVVSVTALGVTLTDARARAYATVNAIEFQGAHYRTDIGRRERKQ